jgi:hypothetical protein
LNDKKQQESQEISCPLAVPVVLCVSVNPSTVLCGPQKDEKILFPSLKLGNNKFDSSRFARRCKQRQPQNMAHITSGLSVRK